MVDVLQREMGGEVFTDIVLTRGDACTIVLPLYSIGSDGTKSAYSPSGTDSIAIVVSRAPKDNASTTPTVIFNGSVSPSGRGELWEISSTNSTQDAGSYYWDMKITTSDGVFTLYKGWLKIVP